MTEFTRDTDAEVFNREWPSGYTETFEGFVNLGCTKYVRKDIVGFLSGFYNDQHTCLEIGCGGGMWTTENLIPNFKRVIGLDVVPQKFTGDCTYIRVPDRDFNCTGVEGNSIDFLFTFGVFCHLSSEAQGAYLKSAFSKMKSGAKALVLFANFSRHPNYCNMTEKGKAIAKISIPDPNGSAWFYMDLETSKKLVEEAGFVEFIDLIPDFRDTLCSFKKP